MKARIGKPTFYGSASPLPTRRTRSCRPARTERGRTIRPAGSSLTRNHAFVMTCAFALTGGFRGERGVADGEAARQRPSRPPPALKAERHEVSVIVAQGVRGGAADRAAAALNGAARRKPSDVVNGKHSAGTAWGQVRKVRDRTESRSSMCRSQGDHAQSCSQKPARALPAEDSH